MSGIKKIKNALISVYCKDKLKPIIQQLETLGINIYSTGGTQKFIEEQGIKSIPIESLTSYPSILGGRVKTLHPKIFGGILSRRDLYSDNAQLIKYEIPEIDLVIVDLYPFKETILSTKEEDEIIEKIDIGGNSLIRAGAKNFKDVIIVPSKNEYEDLLSILKETKGISTLTQRKNFAKQAFNISSHYDIEIFNYFNDNDENIFKKSIQTSQKLKYGENPHQKGIFYGKLDGLFNKIQGKELSYNNLLDIDSALNLISEFNETTFAILKHTNTCGIASRPILLDAWKKALACDPISAFGGILITNKVIDIETAKEINKIFYEVIIAPGYNENALELLKLKKKRIILQQKNIKMPTKIFKSLLNGVIEQDKDLNTELKSDMKVVTKLIPTENELNDLEFACKVAKHTKSNTIVLVKNNQLIGSGVGQTSRVDALKQGIVKAKNLNFDLKGSVIASDAFFPFADCVEIAHNSGISAIIHPGGSIRDNLSIEYCDNNKMTMVTTGIRHFKH